jgi:hypothetical protein
MDWVRSTTGISYELPSLGKFAWENSVASPYEQVKTIAVGMDDSTPGQVFGGRYDQLLDGTGHRTTLS